MIKDNEIFREVAPFKEFIDKEKFKYALYHNESDLVNAIVSAWYHTYYTNSQHFNRIVAPLLHSYTTFSSYNKIDRVAIVKDLFDWIPVIISNRRKFAVVVQDYFSNKIVYQSFGSTYDQPRWLVDLGEIYNLGYVTRLRYELEKVKRRFIHKPTDRSVNLQTNRKDRKSR